MPSCGVVCSLSVWGEGDRGGLSASRGQLNWIVKQTFGLEKEWTQVSNILLRSGVSSSSLVHPHIYPSLGQAWCFLLVLGAWPWVTRLEKEEVGEQ